MSTDIIYRSVVKKTGEEVLVYRNIFDNYKDLKSNREFKLEELKDFISLTKILGIASNIAKSKAVRVYYDCQYSEIELHSAYIGDLAIVREANEFDLNLDFGIEIIATNRVFQKNNITNEFIDMDTYESYKTDDFKVGKIIVVNPILINERFKNELPGSRESKQKIIRFCQKKFSEIGK